MPAEEAVVAEVVVEELVVEVGEVAEAGDELDFEGAFGDFERGGVL